MIIGRHTRIEPTVAVTEIRGGGYGAGAWVARITGSHPRYHLERDFLARDWSHASRSRRSGLLQFPLVGPGVYEYREFCVGSTAKNWRADGFFHIDHAGQVHPLKDPADLWRLVALYTLPLSADPALGSPGAAELYGRANPTGGCQSPRRTPVAREGGR